jgi:alanine dehydrogenase
MLAGLGVEEAVAKNAHLMKGLNVYGGHVVYEPVARDLHMEYKPYQGK